jgi:hypothetical protein
MRKQHFLMFGGFDISSLLDPSNLSLNVGRIFFQSMNFFLHRHPHFYAISGPIKLLETLKILGSKLFRWGHVSSKFELNRLNDL